MPLLAFWKTNREEVLGLSVQQLVSSAGDGKLRDNSPCADEFRQFLRETPSEKLFEYIDTCLQEGFTDSGLVLQDLVNELGRRLEFKVENGLYRGKKSAVGFDGIWRSEGASDIITEVKTTDYVTVSLDKIAGYRKRLVTGQKVDEEATILVVVGREDTGALEAQIRGSRYAWDMRLISVDGLIKLLQIKEKSKEENTVRQIKELLRPVEYTKLDKIIDVIFTASEDVGAEEPDLDSDKPAENVRQDRTTADDLNAVRNQSIVALSNRLGRNLVKLRQAMFASPDGAVKVCATVSKRYERTYQAYWYAFHQSWFKFLEDAKEGYFVLACMDRPEAYALPFSFVRRNLENLNRTNRPNERGYWHIGLSPDPSGQSLALNLPKAGSKAKAKLAEFRLELPEIAATRSEPLVPSS